MRRRLALVGCALILAGASCSFGTAKKAVNEAVNTAQQAGDVVSGAADLAIKAKADLSLATSLAHDAYNRAVANEQDLRNGPCLANPIAGLPGWVVDIAHRPRQDVDDKPENQCAAYRNGSAKHFVELDPTGQLIRAE